MILLATLALTVGVFVVGFIGYVIYDLFFDKSHNPEDVWFWPAEEIQARKAGRKVKEIMRT